MNFFPLWMETFSLIVQRETMHYNAKCNMNSKPYAFPWIYTTIPYLSDSCSQKNRTRKANTATQFYKQS